MGVVCEQSDQVAAFEIVAPSTDLRPARAAQANNQYVLGATFGAVDVVTPCPREEPGVGYVQPGQKRLRREESLLGLRNDQQSLSRETFRTTRNSFHSELSSIFMEIPSIVS